mgnify:CR=1 FL=1
MPRRFEHDVLIIGSGAAGLSLALHLPDRYRVAVLTKADVNQGSTYWAPVSYTHLTLPTIQL